MSLTLILKAGAGEKTRGKLPPKHLEFLEAVEQIKLDSSSRRIDCGCDGKIEVPYPSLWVGRQLRKMRALSTRGATNGAAIARIRR